MPNYVAARAILPDIENFDAGFFDMTPREAALLDPQQRLLLECAQEALDASGCAQDAEARPCGVFAGVGMNAETPRVDPSSMFELTQNHVLGHSVTRTSTSKPRATRSGSW